MAAETDMRIQRAIMERVPEVKGMMARAGADELGIDPVGLNETDNVPDARANQASGAERASTG